MKRSPRERGAKATRSIIIEPVDRLTVNTEQLLPADGIVVATDGSIIYRQHPLCLMPEATTLDFYTTHTRLWNAGRFHASRQSRLLPMLFVDLIQMVFLVLEVCLSYYFVCLDWKNSNNFQRWIFTEKEFYQDIQENLFFFI